VLAPVLLDVARIPLEAGGLRQLLVHVHAHKYMRDVYGRSRATRSAEGGPNAKR
jgi:hypothetical protein